MNDNAYLQMRRLIALIEDGDRIAISVSKGTLELLVDSAVLEARKARWKSIKKRFQANGCAAMRCS